MVSLFHHCCPNGLGTLKFHLFDHIVDDILLLKTSIKYIKLRQRVFGLSWDSPNLCKKQSFVVIKGLEGDDLDVFWVS